MTQALDPSQFPPRDPADSLNAAPPTIYDPYLVPLVRPARPRLSGLALGSVLVPFLLGPIGSVAAIALGWAARRDIEAHRAQRRGHRLATAGVALGVLTMMAWAAGAVVAAWILIERASARPAAAATAPVKEVPAATAEAPSTPPDPASGTPPAVQAPSTEPQAGGTVPKTTVVKHEGAVTVVDVGVSARSLSDELMKQLTSARAAGETMVVMTTREPCDPCRGVDRALSDPRIQTALSKVRLVRIDIDVFHEDLDQLKVPRRRYPGFFLMAPDLSLRDGIDGGEWDDDIPENIAPVLGPFVRGSLAKRREPWHPPPGSGIAL